MLIGQPLKILSHEEMQHESAQSLGAQGGAAGAQKGGQARMAALTAAEGSKLSRQAAAARWKKSSG